MHFVLFYGIMFSLLILDKLLILFSVYPTLGSPFQCIVDQINGTYVTAFGSGLVGGMSGQMESFTVTAKQGTLSKYDVITDKWYIRHSVWVWNGERNERTDGELYHHSKARNAQ